TAAEPVAAPAKAPEDTAPEGIAGAVAPTVKAVKTQVAAEKAAPDAASPPPVAVADEGARLVDGDPAEIVGASSREVAVAAGPVTDGAASPAGAVTAAGETAVIAPVAGQVAADVAAAT